MHKDWYMTSDSYFIRFKETVEASKEYSSFPFIFFFPCFVFWVFLEEEEILTVPALSCRPYSNTLAESTPNIPSQINQ